MRTKSIIIKNGMLNEPGHVLHNQSVTILIEDGKYTRIESVPFNVKAEIEIDAFNCSVSTGMFDLRCQLKDPGFEHQEDIDSGCNAAAAGGFTGLAMQPSTDPIVQTKSQIEYINKRSAAHLVQVVPVGAATLNLESQEITEMYDMKTAGARAFSNGEQPYTSGGGLMRVLRYATTIDAFIMSHAQDKYLAGDGSVNESATTIHTGLRQQANLAETTQIHKEIEIAKYAENRIHFSRISCAESVDLIRKAKSAGLQVTCDVTIWHLLYTDEVVLDFDANYKVTPPFRTAEDREALIAGVVDGTIDAVVTDHNPQNVENKLVEFDYACYGITGLQTFYPIYNQHLRQHISPEIWWERTVNAPRVLLKLPVPRFEVGEIADCWVADPALKWTFDKKTNKSKSYNNPLWNAELTGRCKAVVREHMVEVFD